MIGIWVVLIPILMVDLINPVLFATMVYAAGTKQPIANSSAILLGHTLAYFSAGLILAPGLERVTERLANPQFIDFFIELLIGMLLLWAAFRSLKKAEKRRPKESGELTPIKALGFGAIVNFVGMPFALPYFAALDQILKANLSVIDSVIVLVVYNLLYALPFLIIPVLSAAIGERSQSVLQRINEVVDRVNSYLMPPLLALVGVALVSDTISFFLTGKGLY